MAQYIKIIQESRSFKMYIRLEKGAEPFPESRCDSYWYCDFFDWCCSYWNGVCGDDVQPLDLASLCIPNFRAVVENESNADVNGVRRLKVGQNLITFEDYMGDEFHRLKIEARDKFVNALGESFGAWSHYEYYAAEISAAHAAEVCPEILVWSLPPAAPAVTPVAENADTLAREEIALLRKEIAALRSEMDARQKRAEAMMAAAIRNPDEKIFAK